MILGMDLANGKLGSPRTLFGKTSGLKNAPGEISSLNYYVDALVVLLTDLATDLNSLPTATESNDQDFPGAS